MARVQERHLSNGLRCVAVDMPWLTVAGASLWFRAGQHSADTAKLQTAHLLEHLCMRGPDGDPTKFALSLELQGALFNAVVHREWTMFAGRAPVSSFDMDLSALRSIAFGTVSWSEDHLQVELEVIRSELSGAVRDLSRRLPAEAKALMFPDSPYAVPMSRQLAGLATITLGDIVAFRERHLTPGNAVLVVFGPEPDRLLHLAERHFGQVPAARSPEAPRVLAVPATAQRHLTDRGGCHAAAVAFPGPPYSSSDREAIEMAMGLLVFGMGGRLYRDAVLKHGLTYQVQTDLEYGFAHGVCVLYASLKDAQAPGQFLDLVREAVVDVAAGRITPEEIHRARERYLTFLRLIEENPEQAMRRQGRHLLYTGSPFDLTGTIARLRSLDADALASVWQQYFDWEKATVVTVGRGEAG